MNFIPARQQPYDSVPQLQSGLHVPSVESLDGSSEQTFDAHVLQADKRTASKATSKVTVQFEMEEPDRFPIVTYEPSDLQRPKVTAETSTTGTPATPCSS